MLSNIIIREIHHHVLSLRLHLALGLVLLLFGLGTVAYVKSHAAERVKYERYYAEFLEQSRNVAEKNLSRYATRTQSLALAPRINAFISDAREKYFPNKYWYSAYNVFGFDIQRGAANEYMETFQELNWTFIVAIIISFAVLLFTYDTVSGEKEAKTLAITLSNSVSRGLLLFGKYFSVIITTLLVLAPGVALSLIILLLSGEIQLTPASIAEIAGFLSLVILFVACIAAFGLLASVVAGRSNVSLLVCLCFWLAFVVIVPNTVVFWTQRLFPIDSAEVVRNMINKEKKELSDNAPPGSWSAQSGNPFYEKHELRADIQMKLLLSEKKFKDAFINDMVNQYERARMLSSISPVSLFESLSEAVVGGGYVRLQKVWNDIHAYQTQFLAWFKDIDANDLDSPNWYNPREDFSTTKKGVSWETVPQFQERPATFAERLGGARLSLALLVIYTATAFALSFVLFLKYDVR